MCRTKYLGGERNGASDIAMKKATNDVESKCLELGAFCYPERMDVWGWVNVSRHKKSVQ